MTAIGRLAKSARASTERPVCPRKPPAKNLR